MNYEEFMSYVVEHFAEYLYQFGDVREDDCYQVDRNRVLKNNGIILDGITIRKNNSAICPSIYLNQYFEEYQLGKPMNVIFDEIADCYSQACEDDDFDVDHILDYSKIKNRIVLRLVNYEKNRELLKNTPYKRFLDLAITFRCIVRRNQDGLASYAISNKEFESWNITLDELYSIAMFNTMREFPWHMDSLASVILNSFKKSMSQEAYEEMKDEFELLEGTENCVNIFVLSNEMELNGAICMLYDTVLKNFARVQDSNIFILPSSVHEVMLVPECDDISPDFLRQLVLEANESAVGLIDLLSDSIYYYNKDQDEILLYD